MTKKYGFSQKTLLAKADRDLIYAPLAEANGNKGKIISDNLKWALPDDKAFGLDTSETQVEKIPLVVAPTSKIGLKRTGHL
jgi:hypothetical protein